MGRKGLSRRLFGIGAAACLLAACMPGAAAQESPAADIRYAQTRGAAAVLTGSRSEVALGAPQEAEDVKSVDLYEGYKGAVLVTGEASRVTLPFTIPQTGDYRLYIEYYPVEGSTQSIQRAVYIDEKIAFAEAGCVELERIFKDKPYPGTEDKQGEVRPQQVEKRRWMSAYLQDTQGYYGDLYWTLEAGEHILTLEALREPVAIRRVVFESTLDEAPSYAAYIAAHEAQGAKDVSGALPGGLLKLQAEDMLEKSSQTLYAANDKSSPGTEPYDRDRVLLNYVGGSRWAAAGQWITWEVEVPQSGFYTLAFRFRQNTVRGVQVHRALYIDGALPFEEASDLTFSYKSSWQVARAGGADGAYRVYLEAGKTHELRLQAVLGSLSGVLSDAQRSLETLNEVNWKLMTVLGGDPDLNRDYGIEDSMPEVMEALRQQAEKLTAIAAQLEALTGETDEKTALLRQFARQMQRMVDRPQKIAANYSSFKDNIGALGNWILETASQPLALDYLLVAETGAALPAAEPGLWTRICYQVGLFIDSFIKDYSLVDMSGADSTQKPVTVWIGSGMTGGRDQAQILKQMIDQDFLKTHDVPVQLQLTAAGTILSATLAGKGPDVALQIGGSDPVNYAMRNAVVDLTKFDDFGDVAARFSESALTPMRYLDGVYALPETQMFYVLFYRKDILARLGIDPGRLKTWQDIVEVLGTLQESNLSMALPANYITYSMFLYQMGGGLYKDGNRRTALDEEVAVQAFKLWTNFYVNYQLPVEYNFENRFRLGEMPIGIADYTNYNLLSVSAPEIQGLWDIAPLPGVRGEDGAVNNTAPSQASGVIMMTACENRQGAWEFMKWWTSADVQKTFGTELESVLGSAARYNTANLEAAKALPWTVKTRQVLMEQWDTAKGIPEVPGGYYTSRYIEFAMRLVVNDNESPRDTLMKYVETINEEIALKRNEFRLD